MGSRLKSAAGMVAAAVAEAVTAAVASAVVAVSAAPPFAAARSAPDPASSQGLPDLPDTGLLTGIALAGCSSAASITTTTRMIIPMTIILQIIPPSTPVLSLHQAATWW